MKQIFVALVFLLVATPAAAQKPADGVYKVIYDCKTGDVRTFISILGSIPFTADRFSQQGLELQAIVLMHSQCTRFALKDLEGTPFSDDKALKERFSEITERIKSLQTSYGVKFEQCQASLNNLKIDPAKVRDGYTLVPSAYDALILHQAKGYVYIPLF